MTRESEENRENVEAQKRRKRVLQSGGGNFQQCQMLQGAQDEEKIPPTFSGTEVVDDLKRYFRL